MILWVDVESSGLNEKQGHLLEVALVLTDDDLKEVASTSIVMKPVGIEIDDVKMDDVVREMHTANGLFDEVRKCNVRRHEAEQYLMEFVSSAFKDVPLVPDKSTCKCGQRKSKHVDTATEEFRHPFDPMLIAAHKQTPFAGSTVSFDRAWLKEHMATLEAMFSYRSIDVSGLTELAQRWAPETYGFRPKAAGAHRALADVRESINYLRFFKWSGFVGGCK